MKHAVKLKWACLHNFFPFMLLSLYHQHTEGALIHVTKVANENPHKTSQFLLPFTTFEMPPPTLFLLMLTKSSSDSLLQPPGVPYTHSLCIVKLGLRVIRRCHNTFSYPCVLIQYWAARIAEEQHIGGGTIPPPQLRKGKNRVSKD